MAEPITSSYLRRQQIAAMLDVKPRTFDMWRRQGKVPGPDMVIGSNTIYWHKKTIEDWLAARTAAMDGRQPQLVGHVKKMVEEKQQREVEAQQHQREEQQ